MYIYKNITKTSQLLTLVSNQHNSVSHITVGVGATVELSYPGLDIYLPHILARLDEGKNNITAEVIRKNSVAIKSTVKPVATFSTSSASPTIVQPGIYVAETKSETPTQDTKVVSSSKSSKASKSVASTASNTEGKAEQTTTSEDSSTKG